MPDNPLHKVSEESCEPAPGSITGLKGPGPASGRPSSEVKNPSTFEGKQSPKPVGFDDTVTKRLPHYDTGPAKA
jgi:hypothetical protein